jgi:hypothetical protein
VREIRRKQRGGKRTSIFPFGLAFNEDEKLI